MQLTKISSIQGKIELVSGLHIGSGNTEMHIGGTDNPVVKNPVNNQPYIPGSSLKGKMRSLMEWQAGLVADTDGKPVGFAAASRMDGEKRTAAEQILMLFGGAPEAGGSGELVEKLGPTRLAFWDCALDPEWVKEMEEKNLLLTEVKMENSINRIAGTAENPRNTERVPAGARFDFRLTLKVHDNEDLLDALLKGLRLVEMTGIGGSGSRGYGKVAFAELTMDGESIQDRYETTQP